MKISTTSRSNLFLIELIIVILFFSLSAAAAVQIYAKSHDLAEESRELTMATLTAQTAAETMKSVDGNIEEAAEKLCGTVENGKLTVNYDGDWKPTIASPSYTLSVTPTETAYLTTAVISLNKGETIVYTMKLSIFKEKEASL